MGVTFNSKSQPSVGSFGPCGQEPNLQGGPVLSVRGLNFQVKQWGFGAGSPSNEHGEDWNEHQKNISFGLLPKDSWSCDWLWNTNEILFQIFGSKKTLQICRPLELTLDTMNLLSFLCFHVCLVIWIHVEHSPALPGTVSILDFCRGEAFGAQMLENGVPCGQAVRLDHPTNRKWWIFLVISPHSLGYPISLFDSHLKLVHEILIPIYSLLKLVNDIYFP